MFDGLVLAVALLSLATVTACSAIQVPDVKVCAVAGRLQAGADCAYTGHTDNSEMDMAQTVKMLEDGAVWMSSADYARLKTAIESLCYKMGQACQYEQLKAATARVDALQHARHLPADTPATH